MCWQRHHGHANGPCGRFAAALVFYRAICQSTVSLPPWSVEDNGTRFAVKDQSDQALAYVYYESASGHSSAAELLTRDEARRIAANIAKLAELLRQQA